MQTGAVTLENSMEVPQKVKNRTTTWSSNCTSGYLTKEYKNINSKGYMYPYVYSSIIYNIQIMEVAQGSTDWWMDKEDVVFIYNGILTIKKKKWKLAICNNMDGAKEYYAKWNKSLEKDK